jgi:50S ribosomal protein L16 3-hydroxylase
MDVHSPLALLDGLSPQAFMRRHWQKKPLLVRAAWPQASAPLTRAALFALAAREDVESRLVVREGRHWRVEQGPLARRALPKIGSPGWTLLVQGLEQHVPAARELLDAFRFVPEARLDDLMLSWASAGGGVGPHVDSYDVFLLQVAGRRRWRFGPAPDRSFRPGLPLKILRHFAPTDDAVLEAGDLLYLPPGWGHDGTAVGGDCMTASIGFRAPGQHGLAGEIAQRLAELAADATEEGPQRLYRDAAQPATAAPGALPPALLAFARQAVERLCRQPQAVERALGELLSEPKPRVWFSAGPRWAAGQGVALAPASRLLYDARHVYINGEAFEAGGKDASLLHELADRRCLPAARCRGLSAGARGLLSQWQEQGWLVPMPPRRK